MCHGSDNARNLHLDIEVGLLNNCEPTCLVTVPRLNYPELASCVGHVLYIHYSACET